uniref:Uncharacterized protein n=1 Tax=Rhizophora mucronata TaxID=61149 RepID=A0A2P2PE31_RHIMU
MAHWSFFPICKYNTSMSRAKYAIGTY